MTPGMLGVVLGGFFAGGLLLVVARMLVIRRTQLALRVLPYVRDLPQVGRVPALRVVSSSPAAAAAGVFGPPMRSAADLVEKVLGGARSIERRLQRARIHKTVHEFRLEQVVWGLIGFGIGAAYGLLKALGGGINPALALIICALGFAAGVIARDNRLSAQATNRERQIVAEFPTIAELLALAVAAGESPVAALDRVVRRSRGELSADLADVLARVRTGEPVSVAFDGMAASTGLPLVARFATGVAVAVERGTPLADVLHAQAADVREAGRRELIESAARKEVFMMAPVVFLVLPITIVFAFYPGAIGLNLTTP
ncbi:type II secretion system F family protein [Nocardioides sp. InS609-2]|uniref:type II secretion system F family protein n=1 Tax=Nocardioides sp. InS609-2 TaxID=2760705 RepID=UPI0020C04DB4|nr:type II secretion system F family protein [Nocardioides sp. InS609-2]